MKQFLTIFKFEFKYYLKNKVFVGVTLFFILLIAAIMFFPRVASLWEGGTEEEVAIEQSAQESDEGPASVPTDAADLPVMLIAADVPENASAVRDAFASTFTDYNVQVSAEDAEGVKAQILSGEAACAFVLEGLTSYTYYVDTLSMYDNNEYMAEEILQRVCRLSAMMESGLSAEAASDILSLQITHHTESLGKNQMQNFFYTYIMIFVLYMVILLYGQMVATNVATEKSSRAMEVLITSARPVSMMFGKVIASCLAGLLQLVAIFGSALLFYRLNQSYWGGNMIIDSFFAMPVDLLLYMLLFFVLGFFMYAFMFGAVGSTASKLEDINTSVMPVTMLFVVGFMVAIFSMSSGNMDNVLMKICSYVPFTSPMAMFTRIAMSTVPAYEIILSVGILIASVIGVGFVSAKIYRVGVLLYGTTPKLGNILKAVWKA